MKFIKKSLLFIFFVIAVYAAFWAYSYYNKIFVPNIVAPAEGVSIYIPTGADIDDVFRILDNSENLLIADIQSLMWIAEQKNYSNHIHAGRYILKNNMTNNELINLLRSGMQTPVRLTINNVRTKQELAGKVARQIEADSVEILDLLNDKAYILKYGFKPQTVISLFIPNTYELYWNTSAEKFFDKMRTEYKRFWTAERKAKAKKMGLSQSEVATLASIVQAEQSLHNDEKSIIAGLFLNRLRKKMLLQSDPTVVFAVGDFSIRRVLDRDKQIDSPYNTYKYAGLPPGPINLPEISSLKAVLNYKKNNYIYMCAKDDFSGYHYFSRTLQQHGVYARKYRKALNKRGIRR